MRGDMPIDGETGRPWEETMKDALVAGSIVCAVTVTAVALRGRADSGSAVAPINATSHVLYGPEAASADRPDLRHTIPGLLINAGACVFWATVYERLFEREPGSRPAHAVLGGTVVAALAYLVDYHLVPKRLTPGWEERVSGRSLAMIFAAMAASLPLRNLLRRLP